MTWDAMVSDETRTERIIIDHQPALTALEDAAWNHHGKHRFGQSYLQGYRRARRDIISWMHHTLTTGFDQLTGAEVVAELRKGDQSLYWPIFLEEQKAWIDCDHCRTRQLIDSRGICDRCGTEVE